eukprot:5509685-Heterocapsa_arctica.AAC.1
MTFFVPYYGSARPSATIAPGRSTSGSMGTSGYSSRGQVFMKATESMSSSLGTFNSPMLL